MFQKCYNENIEISFGERVLFIMKKLNKKALNSSLVIILALGLGGCAINSATTTHVQDSTRTAKVTKQSSSKKAAKADSKTESNKSAAATQSNSTAISQEGSSQATMTSQAATSTKSSSVISQQNTNTASATSTSTSVANNSQNTTNVQQNSTPKAQQEIQLGLGDVASWTDSQGTTHHVDSDGMDRYTTKGSQEVQYQDWSGSLPQNATVNHQNWLLSLIAPK